MVVVVWGGDVARHFQCDMTHFFFCPMSLKGEIQSSVWYMVTPPKDLLGLGRWFGQ